MDNKVTAEVEVKCARLLLIGATLFWGLSFPLMRGLEIGQHAQVPGLNDRALASANIAARFGLAAFSFLPFCALVLRDVTRSEWSQALGLAVFAGFGNYLQMMGLIQTNASVSAFLTQLYTLIVPLIVSLRDRRLPTLRVVLACLLVLTGAALLSPGLLTHFTLGAGEGLILLSTVFFAAQIVWIERPGYAENRAGVVTMLMFSLLGIAFVLVYGITGGTVSQAGQMFSTPLLVELMAALALFCTALNFFIMNRWQRWVPATEAGIIYCLEPVVASVLASFLPSLISRWGEIDYPNESLTWMLLLGGGLIIAATCLVVTKTGKESNRGGSL